MHRLAVFTVMIAALTSRAEPKKDAQPIGVNKPGEIAEVEIARGVRMKFCWVPEGKATLGSPASEKYRSDTEKEHEFTTMGFWMGKYTVTQGEWETLMGSNPSWFAKNGGGKEKVAGMDTSRFPVEMVKWTDSQEFMKKLNETVKMPAALGKGRFALPHEDQWEYACRGGKGNKQPFYFGDELNGRQANVNGKFPYGTTKEGPYLERTKEVGSYEQAARHAWGLCDMGGNVLQWCENKYDDKNDRRVLRGGSWLDGPRYCRSAYRDFYAPDVRSNGLGFRVVVLP